MTWRSQFPEGAGGNVGLAILDDSDRSSELIEARE